MKRSQLYRCSRCGMQLEITAAPTQEAAPPVCCQTPMDAQTSHNQDGAVEKHLPVTTSTDGKLLVKVGSRPHPMTPEHFIEWIEVSCGNCQLRRFLNPGEPPQAEFPLPSCGQPCMVRISCNLHGIWSIQPLLK